GGTGKTGRRVVARLTAQGEPVRIGSRSGGVPFDWADPGTWAPALDGAKAAYVSYYPDLAAPGAAEAIGSVARVAGNGGARGLGLLAGRGEEEGGASERALTGTGADWTVLRCSWFSQNFSEGYLLEPVVSGHVALPAGPVGEPFVDVEDIADVAAAVLTQDGHSGQVYELTGPRLLPFPDAAAATARPSGPTPPPPAACARARAEEGAPAEVIELLTYLFTTVLDGRNAHLSDGIQQVLGRPARDFADFARDAAAAGVWNPLTVHA